jgi:hypothetical protein
VYVETFVNDKSIPVIEYAAVQLLLGEMLVLEALNVKECVECPVTRNRRELSPPRYTSLMTADYEVCVQSYVAEDKLVQWF